MIRSRLCVLVVMLGLSAPGWAQEPNRAALVADVKAATGFVEVQGRAQGAAFCIHDSGLFVTSFRVAHGAKEVKLVLHSGEKDEETVTATVLRTDEKLDLALLKVDEIAQFKPLPLGSSDGLAELSDVIVGGFPFGTQLAFKKGEYPAISINQGRISSLRKKEGELDRIQIDTAVPSGSSGGPLVGSKGKVIGVIVSSTRGVAVNTAIPVSHVRRLTYEPNLEVMPPTIAYADRFKKAAFRVKAVTILPAKDLQMDLVLVPAKGPERTYKMEFVDGTYRTEAEALVAAKEEAMVRVSLTYPGGTLTGMVKDQSLTIGSETVKLSAVRRIDFGPEAVALLEKTKTVRGAVKNFDDLVVALGSDSMKINPTKAKSLAVERPDRELAVAYRIVVRKDGKELANVRHSLTFANPPKDEPLSTKVAEPQNKLDGFWRLEKAQSSGKATFPMMPEEAIYIEGTKVLWVTKEGQIPYNASEADLVIDSSKSPAIVDFQIRRGQVPNNTWYAIYKIEGDRLIIATSCNADRRPTEFTTMPEKGGADFVRTYQKVKK